ncbi:hypothetical protein CHELA1G11_21007 [Hyphomicrobiales bacterium]|nr:hypothetical protein CHELA1G11_21007 [Hyphomicrobiales bacterium]
MANRGSKGAIHCANRAMTTMQRTIATPVTSATFFIARRSTGFMLLFGESGEAIVIIVVCHADQGDGACPESTDRDVRPEHASHVSDPERSFVRAT